MQRVFQGVCRGGLGGGGGGGGGGGRKVLFKFERGRCCLSKNVKGMV